MNKGINHVKAQQFYKVILSRGLGVRSSAWIERLPSIFKGDSRKSRDRSPPGPLTIYVVYTQRSKPD